MITKAHWSVRGIYGTPGYNYETFVVATSNKRAISLLRRRRSSLYGIKTLPSDTKIIRPIIVVKRR